MTGPRPASALARCVDEPDAFLRDTWSVASALHHAGANAFDDLLSVADIDALVDGAGLRLPFARMVRDGVTIDPSEYTYQAGVGSRPVDDLLDPARVVEHFATGATLVLQGLHRNWPPLAAFCDLLSDELGHPVQANAYLSTRANRGFELHYDIHDVFVLQVTGSKTWDVFDPPVRWPAERWSPSDEARTRIEGVGGTELRIEAGDCLYLPKGHPHRALADDAVSLHITVGVPTITRAMVVEEALRQAMTDERLRAPIAPGAASDPDILAAEVRAALDAFADAVGALDDGAVAGHVRDRVRRSRSPRPQAGIATVLRLPEVHDGTRIAPTGAAGAPLEQRGDRVALVLADRTLSFPVGVEPALEAIVTKGELAVGDLPGLDAESRLVLARRLLREGAVAFADGP